MLIVILRFVHVLFGAIWLGTVTFTTFFLAPAMTDAGPDAGKVMQGLQRRGFMVFMPVIALLTIVSGAWLMIKLYGTSAGFMATNMGKAIVAGAASALLAFIIGMAFARPAMMRAATVTDPAEGARLRARAAALGKVVTYLVLIAGAAMAVARYI